MSAIPNVKPLTVIEWDPLVPQTDMVARVEKTRREQGEILQAYHDVWYTAPHTWHALSFLGIGMMKCPNDLWMYQELITNHRPQWILETGTYQGGSALWFAFLMDILGIQTGHVYTIDFEDHRRCSHPRITFLAGDSRDPVLAAAVAETAPFGPRLISLDADHSADHVYRELCLYAPLTHVGDWLVVEDTNISWSGEHGDRGARGGLTDYLREHPGEFRQDVWCERWLLTMHPGGWLQRIAPCAHG